MLMAECSGDDDLRPVGVQPTERAMGGPQVLEVKKLVSVTRQTRTLIEIRGMCAQVTPTTPITARSSWSKALDMEGILK